MQQALRALADHPLVGDARGVGLLGAVELMADKAQREPFPLEAKVGEYCMESALKQGLIVRSIEDKTPLPHNGCRPPKRRRV